MTFSLRISLPRCNRARHWGQSKTFSSTVPQNFLKNASIGYLNERKYEPDAENKEENSKILLIRPSLLHLNPQTITPSQRTDSNFLLVAGITWEMWHLARGEYFFYRNRPEQPFAQQVHLKFLEEGLTTHTKGFQQTNH